MKLLIVEDEQVTRENLGSMLNYRDLGFTEVVLASDGEDGLNKARRMNPEVILTDIRMPGMDGTEMAEKIREEFPACQIIFLSAYEELDYYKAAIRMKAANYLEKPVAPAELERVLSEAAGKWQQENRLEQIQSREELEELKPLALKMSQPKQKDSVLKMMKEADVPRLQKCDFVTTLLLSFRDPVNEEIFMSSMADWTSENGQVLIYAENSEGCYVLQILTSGRKDGLIRRFATRLRTMLQEGEHWYLSVGETVPISKSYQSYQGAALGMQECFFEPYGYVAYQENKEEFSEPKDECRKEKDKILEAIDGFAVEEALNLEENLFQKLMKQKNMLNGRIRGMYYDFFEAVLHECGTAQIQSAKLEEFRQTIRRGDIDRENYRELHETFIGLIQEAGHIQEDQAGEDSLILRIKNYVEDNYRNPQLTLLEVADYVNLSVSYICVTFKEHTGMTINQYLTDVRMKQAKKYLTGTRYSIGEISRMTGYQDSSYFGRIFKKMFHVTPVEYRERKGKTDD